MVPDEGVVLAVLPDFIGPTGAAIDGDELHDVWFTWVPDGVFAIPFVFEGEAVGFRVRGEDAFAFGVLVGADAEDGCSRAGGPECAVFIPRNENGDDDSDGFHGALRACCRSVCNRIRRLIKVSGLPSLLIHYRAA